MTDVGAMLLAYPGERRQVDEDALVQCIRRCLDCAQVCTACADACVVEEDAAHLAVCTSLALTCADLCEITARVVTRQTGFDARVVEAVVTACMEACRACYDECRKHALEHEHCRVCAEACRQCGRDCRKLLEAGLKTA